MPRVAQTYPNNGVDAVDDDSYRKRLFFSEKDLPKMAPIENVDPFEWHDVKQSHASIDFHRRQ